MPFDLTIKPGQRPVNPQDAKRAAIEAARNASKTAAGKEPVAIQKYIAPADCPDRTRIVFDDSGSMMRYLTAPYPATGPGDAQNGVVEYLRNCVPNQTAVAVHFMNSGVITLKSDLVFLGQEILEKKLNMSGTPFFNTLKAALKATPTLTRMVAFTDGSPTDQLEAEDEEETGSSASSQMQGFWSSRLNTWTTSADIIIKIAHAIGGEKCIPIDTVFFGQASQEREIALLRYLSNQTGGYFLHFDPAKVNFRTAFKYLAPVNRLMLASESFRADVESGRKA
jgi:hypothetical protein